MPRTGSSQAIIRVVQEDDIIALGPILTPDVSMEQLCRRWREHQNGYREMMVADLDGRVVGTISMAGSNYHYQHPNSLRMFALDVGTAYRRRGIGTALIVAVEEEARLLCLQTVNLEVAVANVDATRLYEALGYQSEGDPIIDRWQRLSDDGSSEQVEELSWVMIKKL